MSDLNSRNELLQKENHALKEQIRLLEAKLELANSVSAFHASKYKQFLEEDGIDPLTEEERKSLDQITAEIEEEKRKSKNN